MEGMGRIFPSQPTVGVLYAPSTEITTSYLFTQYQPSVADLAALSLGTDRYSVEGLAFLATARGVIQLSGTFKLIFRLLSINETRVASYV